MVRCDKCGIDYDARFVSNEVQHNGANHVMFFDCPNGHHCEARRLEESQEQEKSELARRSERIWIKGREKRCSEGPMTSCLRPP